VVPRVVIYALLTFPKTGQDDRDPCKSTALYLVDFGFVATAQYVIIHNPKKAERNWDLNARPKLGDDYTLRKLQMSAI